MSRKLLLADDSVTIQKVVGISFANEDVRLVTVDNGDDALARIREERPDLVLADVVMPGKSGYEVCEAIKSDPELRHIPVLLLSGTFEAFDDDRAQRAGADGHITKPFEAQTLVDRVNQLLASAGAGAERDPNRQAGSREPFDFFDDERGLADAGETSVLASDDLDFSSGDDAFVFESSDPLSEPRFDETLGSSGRSDRTPPDPWSPEPDRAPVRELEDEGLEELGWEDRAASRERAATPVATRPKPSAPDAVGSPGREPAEAPLAQREDTRVGLSDFDVSSSDLGEPPSRRGDAPTQAERDALRGQILDALEKIAWEAFGDLTDQLVKQTVAKVEAIAWEVIPEMAERLVREEIEKLRQDELD